MILRNFLILSIIVVMSRLAESKFRGIPRRVRSDPVKSEDNEEARPKDVFERCMGYPGLVPLQPLTSPDDTDNISLIVPQPTQWVLRNIDTIPNPFLQYPVISGSAYFCLEGDQTLYPVFNYTDESYFLIVDKLSNPPMVTSEAVVGGFFWYLVSVRDSPVKGNILVDIRLYCYGLDTCCGIAFVNNVLRQSDKCSCDKDPGVLTLHAVKFWPYPYPDGCADGCWIGLFTLCSSADCTERITSLQINNVVTPLLPIVLTTGWEKP